MADAVAVTVKKAVKVAAAVKKMVDVAADTANKPLNFNKISPSAIRQRGFFV